MCKTSIGMIVRLTFVIFILSHFSTYVQAQYGDVRCKCVCPSVRKPNSSEPGKKIYVRFYPEPSLCKCENVVDEWIQKSDVHFCDRCNCQWQRRNTETIKVVILFIICIVSLLVLYMLFLLCLDPLLSRRKRANYIQQRNEEMAMYDVRETELKVFNRDDIPVPLSTGDSGRVNSSSEGGVISRVKRGMERVQGVAEKWKAYSDSGHLMSSNYCC